MISGIGNHDSYSSYLRNQTMGRSDPADMLAKIDSDGSNGVSQTELEDWIGAMSEKTGVSIDTTDAVATWDTDGDGELSSDELGDFMKSAMPPPPGMMGMGPAASAEGLFQALDADESDGISESELTQWASDMSQETGESVNVSDTFADYDADEDGELDATELDSFLSANGIGPSAPSTAEDEDDENTGILAADSDSVISEYDTNGDGVLSSDELQAYLDDTETSSPRQMMHQAISSYTMSFENFQQFDFQEVFMNLNGPGSYGPIDIPA